VNNYIKYNSFQKSGFNTLLLEKSYSFKDSLTIIKGFSQLILENYKRAINEEVSALIENILQQSLKMEKIIKEVENGGSKLKDDLDVLIVEDNKYAIKLIMNYFLDKGYNCKGILNGYEGLETFKKTKPKLVLLDVILPDINGFEICKEIRKYNLKVPIYYITAVPSKQVEAKLDVTGANGFITKPFDLDDFRIFTNILEKKK
jgi:CheY-like chemotaxis protein